MSLVLSLRKSHGFHVGDDFMDIVDIKTPYEFCVKAKSTNEVKIVNMDGWTEVVPGVSLRAGVPANQDAKIVRVMIEAPGKKVVRKGAKETPGHDCVVCRGTKIMTVKIGCSNCNGHGCHRCNQTGKELIENPCPECT